MKVRSIRGFHDILPEDIGRWHHIEGLAKNLFELYGYSEIRIPVLEFTEVFARSIGTTTDIVEKEMYTFTDRDGSSLTLRPEGTAGVVRAYIENSMYTKTPQSKLYYTGMMFRHERPQKGRYRGFYQIGAELFGTDAPESDAELIAMIDGFFDGIGVGESITLELSSLGDGECRPAYKSMLTEYLAAHKDSLCEDCRRRLDTNPLRILDCKQKSCIEISKDAPKMLDNLCTGCAEHFGRVRGSLDSIGVLYTVNPKIVRGLDYYTRTVFEFTTDQLGAQNAVAAGGRYDGLVKELGGPETPAVGFAMGIERIVLLHQQVVPEGFGRRVDIYIAYLGDEARNAAFSLAHELRSAGARVEADYGGKSLKSQMKRADKSGARYTIIIGEDELSRGVVKLRDMEKSSEDEVSVEELKKLVLDLNP
jgi:histidyl-tRNA synthetase